jgi:hypothetical protein
MRRKGERTQRHVEQEFPHLVEVEIPPRGLGRRIELLQAWCVDTTGHDGFATWTRRDLPALKDYSQYRFRSSETAARFTGFERVSREFEDTTILRMTDFYRLKIAAKAQVL